MDSTHARLAYLERLEDLAWTVLDAPISTSVPAGVTTASAPLALGDLSASSVEATVARDGETIGLLAIVEVRVRVRRLTPDLSRRQVLLEEIGLEGVARRNR